MKQEFNWAMDQVRLPPEAEERILRALEKKQSCFRRQSKQWWRLVLAVAAVLALLVGTAIATTYQAGILGIFFQGDTSSLEPYVETKPAVVQDQNYRLTLDSSLFDGKALYAVVTVEGLNAQATERLMNGQAILDYLQTQWGPERAKEIMEQGQEDPLFFQVRMESGNHISSLAVSKLPNPSETSRSWSLRMTLTGLSQPQTEPLTLHATFMEAGSDVQIPINQALDTIHIPIHGEMIVDPSSGEALYMDYMELSPIRFTYVGKYPQTLDYELSVLFHTKDGEVLTCEDLGLDLAIRDIPGPADVFGREFAEIVYTSKTVIDLTQIEAIVLDGQEIFIGQ